MRKFLAFATLFLACTILFPASAVAQCTDSVAMSSDSLRSVALRLHPEAASEHRNTYAVITLLFDSRCRLVHHSLGHRRGPNSLAGASPEIARYRLSHRGTLALLRETGSPSASPRMAPFDDGQPHVVWAFVEGTR